MGGALGGLREVGAGMGVRRLGSGFRGTIDLMKRNQPQ